MDELHRGCRLDIRAELKRAKRIFGGDDRPSTTPRGLAIVRPPWRDLQRLRYFLLWISRYGT